MHDMPYQSLELSIILYLNWKFNEFCTPTCKLVQRPVFTCKNCTNISLDAFISLPNGWN
jgi:hypothetical protein